MANRAAPFTEADVRRAVKPLLALGVPILEVIVSERGVHVICRGEADSSAVRNPWDDDQ